MARDHGVRGESGAARRTFWTAAAFYGLVAFEFFYMASPFAAYFYSLYAPGLRALNVGPSTAWLAKTFLPHAVVSTRSPVLDLHNAVGAVLFLGGIGVFAAAAAQVYAAKLRRRGAVTGGLYRLTRHPQYVALSIAGLGLLLLWPRFLALAALVTMLFAYRLLAQAEERECAARFGRSYLDYAARGRRPARAMVDSASVPRPTGWARALRGSALYLSTLALAFAVGLALRDWTLDSLCAVYLRTSAYVSVARLDQATLERIVAVAERDEGVARRLAAVSDGATRFLDYVLPAHWHVPEIPMNAVAGSTDHRTPQNGDPARYRIVFTAVRLPRPGATAEAIVRDAYDRRPLLEAVVDLRSGRVVRLLDPPAQPMYAGIPVPLF